MNKYRNFGDVSNQYWCPIHSFFFWGGTVPAPWIDTHEYSVIYDRGFKSFKPMPRLTEELRERTELDIYHFFPPITQWCSIFDVLFTGGRGVSDFSVLKYY